MSAEEILQTARTSPTPHGWIVLPLSRSKVLLGIAGWCFGILLGFGLFALTAFAAIPYDFQQGIGVQIFALLLMAVLLFVGFGSIWMLIQDVRRVTQADKHMIVITPQEFVKQEGNKIITVPLTHIRYVTARGTPPPDRTVPRGSVVSQMPSMGERMTGFFMGQAATREGAQTHRRRRRTPTTLAFVDTRTDNEVVVVTDGSYGDPFMIAALLKQYAATV